MICVVIYPDELMMQQYYCCIPYLKGHQGLFFVTLDLFS